MKKMIFIVAFLASNLSAYTVDELVRIVNRLAQQPVMQKEYCIKNDGLTITEKEKNFFKTNSDAQELVKKCRSSDELVQQVFRRTSLPQHVQKNIQLGYCAEVQRLHRVRMQKGSLVIAAVVLGGIAGTMVSKKIASLFPSKTDKK